MRKNGPLIKEKQLKEEDIKGKHNILSMSKAFAKPKATNATKATKARIPKALREQVWLKYSKQQFSIKCLTSWCQNQINAFDFHCGHMYAEAKGGSTTLDNLIPICARCNLSMGTTSFNEWTTKGIFYNIHTMNAVKIGDTLVGPANYVQHAQEVPIVVKFSNKRFWCC